MYHASTTDLVISLLAHEKNHKCDKQRRRIAKLRLLFQDTRETGSIDNTNHNTNDILGDNIPYIPVPVLIEHLLDSYDLKDN